MARSSRTRQQGFTLVEVMMALVLLAIGMLAVGAAQLASLKVASQSQHRSQALYLAEEQMELFQAMPFDDATFQASTTTEDPGNPIEVDAADDDVTGFERSWTIEANTPQTGFATITVEVVWSNPGQSANPFQSVSLQALKETQ